MMHGIWLRLGDLKSLGAVLITALFLAACGGGGTSLVGTDSPPQGNDSSSPKGNDQQSTQQETAQKRNDPDGDILNYEAASAAEALDVLAGEAPKFGSVIQFRGDNPTSDFEVAESNGSFTLSLPRSGGTVDLSIDPAEDSDYEIINTGSVGGRPLTGQYVQELEDYGDTRGGVYVLYPDPADLGEWLVGGAWIHIKSNDNFEYGAFVDGPEIASTRPDGFVLPTSNTAEYNGKAAGMYDYKLESIHYFGQYTGDFEATATFADGGGTVEGTIDTIIFRGMYGNYEQGGSEELPGIKMTLQEAEFDTSGEMTGNVIISLPGTVFDRNKGKWGSTFSSVPTSDTDAAPRLIAGTHGAYAETAQNGHIGFVGMQIGTHE